MASHSLTCSFRFEKLLNIITALTVLSGASLTVRSSLAERCHNTLGKGPFYTEVRLLGPSVEQAVKRWNPTSYRTIFTTGLNCSVYLPQPINGTKKTFTWRQRADGGPAVINLIKIMNTTRQMDKIKGKLVKDVGRRRIDSKSDQSWSDIKSAGIAAQKNVQKEKIKPTAVEIEKRPDAKNEESKSPAKNLPNIEEACLPGKNILFLSTDTNKEPQTDRHDGSVLKASCSEVKGVCPAMTALSCLASMQSKSESSNMKALKDPEYAEGSLKITIASRDEKVPLTQEQVDLLKDIAEHLVKEAEKPRVVLVEDTSSNKTMKYVIVKTEGNVMVGVPYEEPQKNKSETKPNLTTTPPPTTRTITTTTTRATNTQEWLPRHHYPTLKGERNSFAFIPHAQALVGKPPYCSEPTNSPQTLGYPRPQQCTTHEPHHYAITPETPNQTNTRIPTTYSNPYEINETQAERPYLYNRGRCFQYQPDLYEEILDEGDDYQVHQDDEDLEYLTSYRNWEQPYRQVDNQSRNTNDPNTFEKLCEKTRNNIMQNAYQTTTCNAVRPPIQYPFGSPTPYMVQMGNTKPTMAALEHKSRRSQSIEFPENLTASSYNSMAGRTNSQRLAGHDRSMPNTYMTNHYTSHPVHGLGQQQNFDFQKEFAFRSSKPTSQPTFQSPMSMVYRCLTPP